MTQNEVLLALPKTLTSCLLVAFLQLGPAGLASAEDQAAASYGEELVLAETTSLDEILADPESFEGRRVRVEGEVQEVCPFKGCWMDLADQDSDTGDVLRIKVDDGVIVFPKNAAGATAVAEGTVEIIEMNREQYVRWLAHQAEEKGESLDPSGIGEGPFRRIQIRGAGAVLESK